MLESFLGFEPRMVMFKFNDGLIPEKFSRLTWVECAVPRLCELRRDICLTTEEKARKNLSQVFYILLTVHHVMILDK